MRGEGYIVYQVDSGGEVTDGLIVDVASDVANYEVFGYNNELYLKKDGHIYKIQKRGSGDKFGHYTELYEQFFGKQSSTEKTEKPEKPRGGWGWS